MDVMTDSAKSPQGKPVSEEEIVKGSSLWLDAGKRMMKNRAALAGGTIVLFMIVTALSADLISGYATHFTQEETHSSYVIKPPGARSVPTEHQTYYDASTYNFAFVDTNKDKGIETNELVEALLQIEFQRFDTNGDGSLDKNEFESSPHGLVGNEATLESLDKNKDNKLTADETRKFTKIFPKAEASAFVRKHDKDENELLSQAEFPGVPEPYGHVLGCDTRGRDLLTRLIYGGRISLAVGLLATLVSFLIGVTWGAVAGFFGGRVDNLMMRIVDIMYGMPFMFVVILLMVIFGKNILLLFIALGAIQWLTMSRIVRGQVISLKKREFVEAAESIGVSKLKIVFRHLIPNALGPIIVYSTLTVPAVMLEEAFLSFLGLGVQPAYASWGSLASEGREYLEVYPWLILYPGLALAITLLSLNFLGDGLRDALDPQLKKD